MITTDTHIFMFQYVYIIYMEYMSIHKYVFTLLQDIKYRLNK